MENSSETIIGLAKIFGAIVAGAFALYRFVLKIVADRIVDSVKDLAEAIRENTATAHRQEVVSTEAAAKSEARDVELRAAIDRNTAEHRAQSERFEDALRGAACKFSPNT